MGGNSAEMSQLFAAWVVKFYTTTLKSTGYEAAWLCLRATVPSENWKIPRWHGDGKFYKGTAASYKVVFTIKGPSTLFASPSKEQRRQIDDLRAAQMLHEGHLSDPTEHEKQLAEEIRTAEKEFGSPSKFHLVNPGGFQMGLRKLMADRVQLEPLSVPSTDAVKYRVGDQKHAVFHSEPNKNADRLFLQMLLGTRAQINERRDNVMRRKKH